MQRTYEYHVIGKYNAPLIDYAKRIVNNYFFYFFFFLKCLSPFVILLEFQ